jgi:hypothetical protein
MLITILRVQTGMPSRRSSIESSLNLLWVRNGNLSSFSRRKLLLLARCDFTGPTSNLVPLTGKRLGMSITILRVQPVMPSRRSSIESSLHFLWVKNRNLSGLKPHAAGDVGTISIYGWRICNTVSKSHRHHQNSHSIFLPISPRYSPWKTDHELVVALFVYHLRSVSSIVDNEEIYAI